MIEYDGKRVKTITEFPDNISSISIFNYDLSNTILPPFPVSLKDLTILNSKLKTLPLLPPNLENLNIRDNKIEILPELPSTLEWINIEGNPIREIPFVPYNTKYFYSDLIPYGYNKKAFIYNHYAKKMGKPEINTIPTEEQYNSVSPFLKQQAQRITDLGITFKGSGLPPYVLAEIIDWDLNRDDLPNLSAFHYQQIVQHIIPILQKKDPYPLYSKFYKGKKKSNPTF